MRNAFTYKSSPLSPTPSFFPIPYPFRRTRDSEAQRAVENFIKPRVKTDILRMDL